MTDEELGEVEEMQAVLCPVCGGFPATQSVPHGDGWFHGKFCVCPM